MSGLNTNTKLLIHANGNDGAQKFVDSGNTGHLITSFATAQLDTTVKKIGSSSLLLDGNSDYLSIPDSSDWDWGTNYMWEVFVKYNETPTSTSKYIISHEEDSNNREQLYVNSNNITFVREKDTVNFALMNTSGVGITDQNWHHIAIIKVGDNYGMYLDGVQIDYTSSSTTDTLSGLMRIGIKSTSEFFAGYIDELRIYNDNSYSASPNSEKTDTITVPTSQHVSDNNTKLLLHFNMLDVSGDGGSNSYHNVDFIATAQLDTTEKKFGSASLLLDGNSDYLTIPDSSDFDIFASASDDWTLDLWVYSTQDSVNTNYFSVEQDASNYWRFYNRAGTLPTTFVVHSGGSNIILMNSNSWDLITDIWYHVALIKIADKYGIYINGSQIDYVQSSNIATFLGTLNVGYINGGYTAGYLDEIRIQKSNAFSASPNIGLTDAIVVPTSEYSLDVFRRSQGIIIV